jgi:chemotaxis signal transduction protein
MKKKPRISYHELMQGRATPAPAEPLPAATGAEPAIVAAPPPAEAPVAAGAFVPPPPFEAPLTADADAAPVADAAPQLDVEIPADAAPLADADLGAEPAVSHLVFRVGPELFALPVGDIEEAVDLEGVHPLPEMPTGMLGVFSVRGVLTPLYGPAGPLSVALGSARVALVFRTASGRVALAADDVEDVLPVALSQVRPSPIPSPDGVLTGVMRRDDSLIALLDATALVAAFHADSALELA